MKKSDYEIAYELHKDADTLLHTRLQLLVVSNALLFAGFFAVLASPRIEPAPRAALSLALVACAMAFDLSFLGINRRIIRGINALKTRYLLQEQVYRHFYEGPQPTTTPKAKAGFAFGRKTQGTKVRYSFASNPPLFLLFVWAAMFFVMAATEAVDLQSLIWAITNSFSTTSPA